MLIFTEIRVSNYFLKWSKKHSISWNVDIFGYKGKKRLFKSDLKITSFSSRYIDFFQNDFLFLAIFIIFKSVLKNVRFHEIMIFTQIWSKKTTLSKWSQNNVLFLELKQFFQIDLRKPWCSPKCWYLRRYRQNTAFSK